MRLIINNILSERDKNAIIVGTQEKVTTLFDLTDIESLKKILSEKDRHFFECISWLIANKHIKIKIISPKNSIGISHTKSGVFGDGVNLVGFNGSCNFTQTALLENIESIDAFCDWDGDINTAKIQNTIVTFDNTFSGNDDSVNYIDPSEITISIERNFGNKTIDELLEQEERLFENSNKMIRLSLKKVIDKAKNKVIQTIETLKTEKSKPLFPYPQGAREYQQIAFENWKNNKQQGLFAMATGTGKTITSLNCLLEIYKKTGYYKALILVPTITLVNQWEAECRKFNFSSTLTVSSKNNWKNDFATIITKEQLFPTEQVSFIVISTYASFGRANVFAELNQLPSKTLLIAD